MIREEARHARRGALGVVLASVLGCVSVGWDCTASTDSSAPVHTASDAGASTRDAGDGFINPVADAGHIVVAKSDASAAADANPDAAPTDTIGGSTETDGGAPACIVDYAPCGDASKCCNLACSMGVCGGFLAEGEPCSYSGTTPPAGAAPCGDNLACNDHFCGTNACVPDGTACGGDAGVVCCNDNCNGTVCAN